MFSLGIMLMLLVRYWDFVFGRVEVEVMNNLSFNYVMCNNIIPTFNVIATDVI